MCRTTLKPGESPKGAADASANKLEATVALVAFVTLFFAAVVVGLQADALGMFFETQLSSSSGEETSIPALKEVENVMVTSVFFMFVKWWKSVRPKKAIKANNILIQEECK